jgi:hypothetical protein
LFFVEHRRSMGAAVAQVPWCAIAFERRLLCEIGMAKRVLRHGFCADDIAWPMAAHN